jgi:mono/diheme cytochrome c family protein
LTPVIIIISYGQENLGKGGFGMDSLQRCVVLAGAIMSFLAFSSCAPTMQQVGGKVPEKTPQLLSTGGKLYEENCTQCHGVNGDGKGWKAADLKTKPRDFTLPLNQWSYSKGDPQKIFEALKVGIPDTPMAMFHFTDEERSWIVNQGKRAG